MRENRAAIEPRVEVARAALVGAIQQARPMSRDERNHAEAMWAWVGTSMRVRGTEYVLWRLRTYGYRRSPTQVFTHGVLDATRRRTIIRQQAERIVGITHPDYLP